MANKNTAKETRKTRKDFPLIKFICTILFFTGIILFAINAVTDYKTYTDSEIVKQMSSMYPARKMACWMLNIGIIMAARSMRKTPGNPSAKLKLGTKKKYGYGKMLRSK